MPSRRRRVVAADARMLEEQARAEGFPCPVPNLRRKGLKDVQVVDIAPHSMVLGLIQRDIASDALPLPHGSFDDVVACDILEHVYDDVKALANIHALLRPGGVLVIAGPYWHDADPTHATRP